MCVKSVTVVEFEQLLELSWLQINIIFWVGLPEIHHFGSYLFWLHKNWNAPAQTLFFAANVIATSQ